MSYRTNLTANSLYRDPFRRIKQDPDQINLQLSVSFEGYRRPGPSSVISPNKWRTLISFNAMLPDENSIVT